MNFVTDAAEKAASPPAPREKWNYLGAPACFKLDAACHIINRALGATCYQVGSSLERRDFRDVDVRCILDDTSFERLFGKVGVSWEHDPFWILLCTGVSVWLREQTGLPVDFQVQPMTHANTKHDGQRSPLGLYLNHDLPAWHGEEVHAEKYGRER